ncbi:DUF2637 domain-containing protein [Streptomyces sp. H10-C2]|uniref:DUF2637 domain-containing protein n=1 Tax=unclassified Streptomyces TaxID=2593676 RepID=UPI0024B9AD5E|nr:MULTISPECIES: DUF2637 domain-containing protein [unclassified Streptomyces]MDJ0342804.1 DUF2637 domain-containing protein [Streptomyces sp. PH10-H1]MDJ0372482.1 DUF2637 domain-containing protein [Streptomyces sp. H10-C2]
MSARVDIRMTDLMQQAEVDAPRAGAVPDLIDRTAAKATLTPAAEQQLAEAPADSSDPRAMKALAIIAILGGVLLAGIGFSGSYNTLRHLAQTKGFGLFAYAFPIGIDAGILVLLALDLYMMRKRMPLPILRWAAHGLTAATVAFNAAAPAGPVMSDPLAASMHGIIPTLFIIAVEAARHYIGRMAALLAGDTPLGSVRLDRWILAPLSTPRLARRMRLYGITYKEVTAQHQQLRIYRESLRQKYFTDPRGWRKAATADELLPFKLGPLGLSVEGALAIPLDEETKRIEREVRAAVQRTEAEIQRVETDVQLGAARIQAEVNRIREEGKLKIARAEAEREAQAEIQRAEADAQLREAKRQYALKLTADQAKAEAQQLADETERRRTLSLIEREKVQASWGLQKQQMATEAAENERRIQADSAARVRREEAARAAGFAEQERRRAEAEAARLKALEEAAERERRAAEHRAVAMSKDLEEQRDREEAAASLAREAASKEEAAERLAHAAEHEARAVEQAALARLSQVEWDVRRVVAMIQSRGESAVTVKSISDEMGMSIGSAQDRKTRAVAYLKDAEPVG